MTRAYNTATTQQNSGGAVAGVTAGKNAIINGGMDIWQRGTTFTNPGAGGAYVADRWCTYFNANATVTREATVKPDTSTYSMKLTATTSSPSNDIYQLIEQAQMQNLRGRTVTYSVKLAGTAGVAPIIVATYSTTADDSLFPTGTAITTTILSNPAINASTFVTYAISFTVPTVAKTLRIGVVSNTMANTNVLYIAEAQLELGSVATPFSRAGGTIAGELAACQRYYYRTSNPAVNNAQIGGIGFSYSTTNGVNSIPLPVQMRVVPTSLDYANLRPYDITAGSVLTFSSATLSSDSTPSIGCYTYAFSAATANRMIRVDASSTGGYIGFGAEL